MARGRARFAHVCLMPTRSWACDVSTSTPLNQFVQRLTMDNGISLDVPSFAFDVAESDRLKIEVLQNEETAECVLQGFIYDNIENFSYVSCGGLLAKLPILDLQSNALVRIGLGKNRRRRRAT